MTIKRFWLAAMGVWKIATFVQTVAQQGLNAAMKANLIFAVIGAIAAVITWLVAWVNQTIGLKAAWLMVVNAIITAWDSAKIAFLTGVYMILNLFDKLQLGMMAVGTAIDNLMGDMRANVLNVLQNMVNGAISILNNFIGILNKIPGVNIDLIGQMTFGTQAQLENDAAKQARLGYLAANRDAITANIADRESALNAMKSDAFANFSGRLAEIDAAKSEFAAKKNLANGTNDSYNIGFTPYDELGNIGNLAEEIAANTKNMLDYSEEEIKLWRDISERDAINRYTTAEINVNFGGITNTVNSEMDLDGIVNYIAENVEETLYSVAEGVHA